MQQATNVSLSPFELELVSDAGWILTKNAIIDKVYALFGHLAEGYAPLLAAASLPEEVKAVPPKIARGEKYEGLPWLMLDYPRKFTADHSCAVRTFFWWGNFLSITLHLSGDYLSANKSSLMEAWKTGSLRNAFVSCGADEWQHHFREDNMAPVSEASLTQALEGKFLKLSFATGLKDWHQAEAFLLEHFSLLMKVLAA